MILFIQNYYNYLNLKLGILLQALPTGKDKMTGANINGFGGSFKTIGASIVAFGIICAGIAVVKKFANNSEDAKKSAIGWFVAVMVFYAIWKLI